MRRLIFVLTVLLISPGSVFAQNDSAVPPLTDTLPVKDSPVIRRAPVKVTPPDTLPVAEQDTLSTLPVLDSVSKKPFYSTWKIDPGLPLTNQLLQHHPYFSFGAKPVVIHSGIKTFKGKEVLFYAMIGLLLAFAFLRQTFPKYFNDMFRLLFRNTLKQKQIKEQLIQSPLPSLLLNTFFAITGGLYADLLLQHFGVSPIDNFWLLSLYCSIALSAIYFIKFIGLKVTGWLFNLKGAADSYIFVVFIINKVIGIFLLPFLVMLAFMQGSEYKVVMILSWCGIGILFIYRFLLTYASIRNQVRFNPFHFFLYLCAFEIAPLLLIYKALLFFFP